MEPLRPQLRLRGRPRFVERRARTYFLAGACVLRPAPASCFPAAPARRSESSGAVSWGTARPRGRRRRVRLPPQSHHVRHPGLRHRETRSRPAGVGAQRRPARARRPRDQGAALRPGRDTTASRARPGPALLFKAPALLPAAGGRDAPSVVHSWADRPPLKGPQVCQRHSSILRV